MAGALNARLNAASESWPTSPQAHYRKSIEPDADLSELYKDVFLFHWKEESQQPSSTGSSGGARAPTSPRRSATRAALRVQTLTVSTLSTSTLPIQTMWFRVRANDAAGNPGNWSSTRRFEVKD